MESAISKAVMFLVVFFITITFGIYNAWLFTDMWKWFAVPVLNVSVINTAQAFGLLMVIGWFLSPVLTQIERIRLAVVDEDDSEFYGIMMRAVTTSIGHACAFTLSFFVAKYIVLQFV